MTARLFRLTEMHQRIDDQLRFEQKRLRPDYFEMSRLKKLKLRAKDLIHKLTSQRR